MFIFLNLKGSIVMGNGEEVLESKKKSLLDNDWLRLFNDKKKCVSVDLKDLIKIVVYKL